MTHLGVTETPDPATATDRTRSSPYFTMDFRSTLAGAVTETAIAGLLHHAGYPVVRSSIETIFPHLPLLSQDEYAQLNVSPVLRQLPDLLVLPIDGPAMLLEVKFRSKLTRATVALLLDKVRSQQNVHPQAHTIIARGTSPLGERARADDLVRLLPPGRLELLAAGDLFFHSLPADSDQEDERLEPMWRALRTLPSAFPRLQAQRHQLEQLVPVLRTLAAL